MSLGVYYVIRHKEKDELMPQLRRGKGYTWWNPGKVNTVEILNHKLIGVPRIFPSRRSATTSIAQWAANPNAEQAWSHGDDYGPDGTKIKDDGRKKEDLEVLEVLIDLHNS